MNFSVIFWYLDIIIPCLGIAISIIMLIILIRRFKSESYAWSTRIIVYSVYISAMIGFVLVVLSAIILPIFQIVSPNTSQASICKTVYVLGLPIVGITNLCIVNFFIHRLNISFKDTKFAFSNRISYAFRITLFIIWCILIIGLFFGVEGAPYNIYTKQTDYVNNKGTMCTYDKNKSKTQKKVFNIILPLTILTIFTTNISIWILFVTKLYKLLKACNRTTDHELIKLIKHQTLLVGIAVSGTICCKSLAVLTSLFMHQMDVIIGISVIFLSFPFNTEYFEFLLCDILAKFCCKYLENKMMKSNDSKENQDIRHDISAIDTITTGSGSIDVTNLAAITITPMDISNENNV